MITGGCHAIGETQFHHWESYEPDHGEIVKSGVKADDDRSYGRCRFLRAERRAMGWSELEINRP